MKTKITITLFAFTVGTASIAQKPKSLAQIHKDGVLAINKELLDERRLRPCNDSLIAVYKEEFYTSVRDSAWDNKGMNLRMTANYVCPDAQEFLLDVALNNEEPEYRKCALSYLIWVDAQQAIQPLWQRANEDISSIEKVYITETLLGLGDTSAYRISDKVCYQRQNPELHFECELCYNNAAMPSPIARKYFRYELKNAETDKEKCGAAIYLARQDDGKTAIKIFERLVNSEDVEIRRSVASGLGEIPTKKGFFLLEQLECDSDHLVRDVACRSMKHITDYRKDAGKKEWK